MTSEQKLPHIVYYNDNHSKSPICTRKLSEANGATWTPPSTWQELTREIERGEDKIVFHIDMIAKSGTSIKEFVDSINTISRFITTMPAALKIIVLITPSTTQRQIQELKDAKILGIGYDVAYYSFEQAAECTAALIAGEPYWPEHIISQLPNPKELPTSIYFRGDADTYMTADMMKGLKKNALCRVQFCSNWDELDSALKKRPHQLIFYIGMLTRLDLSVAEIIDSLRTRMQLSFVNVPIGVSIEPTTPMAVIKELKQAGIFGIVPSAVHWGTEETVMALNSVANRIPYWPTHILEHLPGRPPKKIKQGICITPRQTEVLNLIKNRGLTNKQIARAMCISESTVKMHISDLMKTYGVRTRVQLAVLA